MIPCLVEKVVMSNNILLFGAFLFGLVQKWNKKNSGDKKKKKKGKANVSPMKTSFSSQKK